MSKKLPISIYILLLWEGENPSWEIKLGEKPSVKDHSNEKSPQVKLGHIEKSLNLCNGLWKKALTHKVSHTILFNLK